MRCSATSPLALAAIAVGGVLLMLSALDVLGNRRIAERETERGDQLPAGVPGRFLEVDGHREHIVERGTGPALLLVHGTAGTTFDWEEHVLEPLARHRHVIAVDLLGMGFSERSDDLHYSFELWARQLAATLGALGIERCSVVGHSLGGPVATMLAANYPQKVDRLISVDSGPWMPSFMLAMMTPGIGEMMLGSTDYWPRLPNAPPEYARRMIEVYRIIGTRRALLRSVRGSFFHGIFSGGAYFAAYRRITAPTLLLHGGADPIIPRAAAASLMRLLPHSRMIVVEGAGHFLMNDAPDRFVSEVEKFLDEERAQPARAQ